MPGEELPRAAALAEVIAEQAPLGVYATLASSRAAIPAAEHAAAARLMPDLMPIMASDNVRKGLHTFMKQQAGVFKGK